MDMSRISLRPFNISDADDFFSWSGDERVTRHLRWKTLQTREQAFFVLQQCMDLTHWVRSICLDGRAIGQITVCPASEVDEQYRAQICYALSCEYWGRGILTFALKMAIQQVSEELPEVVRLEALVREENRASQRVLEKVGFLKEGLLRKYTYQKNEMKDMIMYSFLLNDELKKN